MIHVRKLVKAGNVSHTVSLPVKWLERHNLKRGDTVYINERSSGELAIFPHLVSEQKEAKEKTIEIDGKSPAILAREVTSGYINNYGSIVLIGDVEKRASELRSLTGRFSAFEITEQTPKRMVIKDLLNVREISVENTISRMDMIIRSMFQDLVKGVQTGEFDPSMITRDADMDKFYFLMYRLVKMVLKDASLANTIAFSTEEALDVWMLTKTLEAVGDQCKELTNRLTKVPKTHLEPLKDIMVELQELYLDAVKAHNLKDAGLAHKVADRRPGVAEAVGKLIAKTEKAPVIDALNCLETITDLVGDLTRLTLTSD